MIYVNSVSVYPRNLNIKVGEWYYGAYAEICPTNATNSCVTWSSNNPAVASVNSVSGYIYANSAGTATIYATAQDGSGEKGSCTVKVSQSIPVSSITLNRTSLTLQKSYSYTLSATVCPTNATNKTITWSSNNTNVATVSGGVVYAKSQGSAKITALAADGSCTAATCYVTVTANTLVSSVTVRPTSKTMTVGDSAYLYATVCPINATNECITWSSSNTKIATVNPTSGLVIAQSAGTATIYATAQDGSGKRGCCSITVNPVVKVSSVTLNRTTLTMQKGDSYTLSATVCPTNATKKTLRWYSNKTSVATVNVNSGVVTAKSAGTATISAVAQDGSGVSGCCKVTVKQTTNKPTEETPENKVSEGKFADPVDVYSGAHVLKNNIISLFGGQGLKLTAHYDSTRLSRGLLGVGWYHNYEKRIEICDCEARVYISPSVYSKYVANESCSVFTCSTPNKNGYVLTVNCDEQYPYCINCNSERTEYYNSEGYLAKIVDHQGFETIISYSETVITITDAVTARKMYLEKNLNGMVSRVYDDSSRQAVFIYEGDYLVGIYDVNGNSLTYSYDEDGRIKSGTDSNNISYFENTYDSCGRVVSQKDGISGSIPSLFEYGDEGRTVTTDRNGNQSIRVFDSNGLLISYTDENGNTKTYSYDSRFNVIEETDAVGNSKKTVYNNFNKPTEITDKNGNKTYFTYDSAGNVTRIRYPENNGVVPEETFTYNNRNQLVQHKDLRGTVTVYTYDSNGMPSTKKVGSKNAVQYVYQNGLLVSEIDAMGNVIQYGHNGLGQTISKTDAENNVTAYEYDLCGNLIRIIDANGKTIVNTYDGNYQKTSVTDANGNKTNYSYNGNMKNDTVTLPDGNSIHYEYDGEDRLVRVTDQAGNITTTQYDKAGRVVSKQSADGGAVCYEYDKVGNVVKQTNPKGAVTIKTYDAMGNILSVTDDNGNITRYQYDNMSRPVRKVNSVGGMTLYTYSAAGDLLSETDALGNKKRYTYDDFGNKLTFTDALGNTTAYTYDANNNLLTVTDALGNITTYTYNSLNQLLTVKDAKNHIVTYGYDALGRQVTITDAKNNVFTTVYDASGNILKTVDAKGNIISETAYNSLNLPVTVTDAIGKTTSYTYNALGKVATATDSLNNSQEYTYNSMGQNTQVRDAANNLSSAVYDTLGHTTQLSGPLGGSTSYTYDNMGRLIAETTSSGGTLSYGYNELNIMEQLTNARGQIRKYFYDALGRVTGYVGAEDSVSYTYDANGNVLTVTDKNGTVKREYDALNRVTKYTDTFGKVIRYEYDSVGNLTKLIYPDNTAVNYEYDANNNLATVTDWANRVTTYTYDVNNMVTGVVKSNGGYTITIYDNKQRIISDLEHTASGAVITGFEYVYDSLGRISDEIHLVNDVKMCYTYDSLSRVTKRTIKNLRDEFISEESFTYDAAGNIVGGSTDSSFVYDANNRLIEYNGQTVTYDMDGNMLSAPLDGVTTAFEYDSANRLVKAGDNAYTYSAEDIRIRNVCGEYETTYTYNTNAKLSQLLMKTTNGIVTKYVYGLGLIGEEKQGCFKNYHFDYRGSTVAITDECGNITDTFKYDTYGRVVERTGESFVIFGYNGRDGVVTDKNGLIYMRARYYSPEMRRFVNADILHGEISNAITLNRYAYANGNPVSNVDPFGLDAQLDKYINTNYSGTKNISLVINSPNIDSRIVANIDDGKLNNGHSFIRLDDGEGNVQYVGFAPKSNSVADMILGRNVEGKFIDDSKTDWNVAKVYKLSDKQYSYISNYIGNLDLYKYNYNIETYNCTTFAVNTVRLQGAATGNFMTVREHDWTLPSDMSEQLKNYKALPEWLPAKLAAWIIEITMGGFYGYTPADAAQDLMKAEGNVLLKQDDLIEMITNKVYIRSK